MAATKTRRKSAKATNGEVSKREAQAARDAALTEKVMELRGKGKTYAEVSSALSITSGKAAFLEMCATVKPKDKIKHDGSDEDLAPKVKVARAEGLSWGTIAARTGVPEGRVKKIARDGGFFTRNEWVNRSGPGRTVRSKAKAKAAPKRTRRKSATTTADPS